MQSINDIKDELFSINDEESFNRIALMLFQLHFNQNSLYRQFVLRLPKEFHKPSTYIEIPFLPISFFKSKRIIIDGHKEEITFSSSGTTGLITSKHYVSDLNWYIENSLSIFKMFFGDIENYCVLALLPSYIDRNGSSLIEMANELIIQSKNINSGFFLDDRTELRKKLTSLKKAGQKTILLGVSFALLDFIEEAPIHFPELIVMETGGMKGRRKELIRKELHEFLKSGFGVNTIYSEYGMTELLSQAYSIGDGVFNTAPWMKILIRDSNDPFSYLRENEVGGMNIIDLANIYSCPFIATQDLGKQVKNGFEILGRFDNSDIRGCNLMLD